jgi:hypothetical protein
MGQPMQMINKLEITTRQELCAWLLDNHDKTTQAWIPVLSKDPDELSYLAVVEESICFGWIDSAKKRIDDVMYQRISPRRKSGNWTELNKERARRLIRMGLMHPQGEKTLPSMDESIFAIRQDVLDAIKSDPTTYENFSKLPPLYIRVRIDNIQGYPQGDDTYTRRLEKFLLNTKQNKLYGDWHDNGRLLHEGV